MFEERAGWQRDLTVGDSAQGPVRFGNNSLIAVLVQWKSETRVLVSITTRIGDHLPSPLIPHESTLEVRQVGESVNRAKSERQGKRGTKRGAPRMANHRIVCDNQAPVSEPKRHAHVVEVGVGTSPNVG